MSKKENKGRADGNFSKEAILDATLMLILKDGLRGIKYKTVADRAGVYPSAVAYHFKDIPSLINAAFLYYLEAYKQAMEELRNNGAAIVNTYSKQELEQAAVRQQVIDKYTGTLINLIAADDEETQVFFLLDRIFRNETLQNPGLSSALIAQDQQDVALLAQFFTALKSPTPNENAEHLMAVLSYFSEQLLLKGFTQENREHARRSVSALLGKILN